MSGLHKLRFWSFTVGGGTLVLTALGALADSRQFFISWLIGEIFWLGIALGSLAWAMIHYLTGGKWGNPARRLFEAAVSTIPLLLLGFIPVCFGLKSIYPWASAGVVADDPVLQHRHIYMNGPAFLIRATIVFALWILLSRRLLHLSAAQDRTQSPEPTRRLRVLSGPGLVLYPLTGTFAFVDWIMSTEADWFSTIFPILICIGQMLSALALIILLLSSWREESAIKQASGPETFHHLGNLLLALTMVWAYLAFSQFLIIWSGDLPHEIGWYLHRIAGGWRYVVTGLFLFHFLIPFFLLLSRRNKRQPLVLAGIAALLLCAHVFDVWWLIEPSFHHEGLFVHWMDITALIGIGGIWLGTFAVRLSSRKLLPVNDPRFAVATTLAA